MSRATEVAFPQHPGQEEVPVFGGLTIREHFAGLAMQGLLAHSLAGERPDAELANWAVKAADALLAELAKVQK